MTVILQQKSLSRHWATCWAIARDKSRLTASGELAASAELGTVLASALGCIVTHDVTRVDYEVHCWRERLCKVKKMCRVVCTVA